VADVLQNGLVDVNLLSSDAPAKIRDALSVDIEVRNGTPVTLESASIECGGAPFEFLATLKNPLRGGTSIVLKAKVQKDPTEPEHLLSLGAGPFTCGFTSAQLKNIGWWVMKDGVPQQTIPSPEFGR